MSEFVATAAWLVGRGGGLLVLVLLGATVGRVWFRGLTVQAVWPLSLALGLGTLGTLSVLAASFGILTPAAWVAGFAGVVLFVRQSIVIWWERHAARRRVRQPVSEEGRAVAILLALASVPLLLLASYPPTGFDALTYHLPFAEALVEVGPGLLPELRFPIFPQLQEALFAVLMVLGGDTAAALSQVVATLGTGWLLWLWGRSIAEPERRDSLGSLNPRSQPVGVWSLALWMGNPLVIWIGASAYVDAGLTFQVTAALFAWERWQRTEDRRWLLVSAASAGFAAATKYLGLFFVATLTAWLLAERRGRRGGALRLWLAGVGITSAGWYLFILHETGNPLFPFYGEWFGFSPWSPELTGTTTAEPLSKAVEPVSRLRSTLDGLLFLALVPYRAVADRGVFHFQAPLSPWYWALLPLVASTWRSSWGRRWSLVILAYSLFWLTTVRDIRFLMPVLPLVSLLAGRGLERTVGTLGFRGRRPLIVGLALLAPSLVYGGIKLAERGPIPRTTAARDQYLARELGGYQALRWLGGLPGEPPSVYGYRAEPLRYYYPRERFLGGLRGPYRYAFVRQAIREGAEGLCDYLQAADVLYLLKVGEEERPWLEAQLSGSKCLELVYEDSRSQIFARRDGQIGSK